MGAPYHVVNQILMIGLMYDEFMNLGRETKKDAPGQILIEWIFYFTALFHGFSKTVLSKHNLT
jgi:hypothetical protein